MIPHPLYRLKLRCYSCDGEASIESNGRDADFDCPSCLFKLGVHLKMTVIRARYIGQRKPS